MSAKKKLYIFENPFCLTNFLVRKFTTLARSSIARNGVFRIALAGGKTPTEFYARLSNLQDESIWQNTQVFLTDERFVGFDHKASNYGTIKAALLDYVPLPPENVHPVPTYCSDAAESARQYAGELRRCFRPEAGKFPGFDFVLLGLGADGHTASLFPDDAGALKDGPLTVSARRPAGECHRISLALPALNASRYIAFLVKGARKARALQQIWEGPGDLPASRVDPGQGELVFLADPEASRYLSIDAGYYHEGEAVVMELAPQA
jgi:6-phosphogluconolactonase